MKLIAVALALSVSLVPSTARAADHVTISEAVRTLLYLPLYHAAEKGFFAREGLEVEIVTAGTATNCMAALFGERADFCQADPMYVPISREKGGRATVVGQVVGRIAVWGLARSPRARWDVKGVRLRVVSTQPQPMTAYVYAKEALSLLGLHEGRDVTLLQAQPGLEVAPLLAGRADYAFTLEPNASTAEAAGAHVIFSWPERAGDRVFTGLMVRDDYLASKRGVVIRVMRAYQAALDDINRNPVAAISTARKYFPGVMEDVLARALLRLSRESVFPRSIEISEKSWNAAMKARLQAGDLRAPIKRAAACAVDIMSEVGRRPH